MLGSTQASLAFLVFVQHKPANDGGHDSNEVIWHLVEMLYLRNFKEAVLLYSLHSPFVKEMLNNWSNQNIVIPQDCKRFLSTVLEVGQQLQWLFWYRHKATKNKTT